MSKRDIAGRKNEWIKSNEDKPSCSNFPFAQKQEEVTRKKKLPNPKKRPKICELAEMGNLPSTSKKLDNLQNTSKQWYESDNGQDEDQIKQEKVSNKEKEETEKQ